MSLDDPIMSLVSERVNLTALSVEKVMISRYPIA